MMRSAQIRGLTARGALLLAALFMVAALPPSGAGGAPAETDAPRPRLGFLAGSVAVERRAEREMLATPTPERERAWLHALTEEPHVAGTPQGKKAGEYGRDRRAEFGLRTEPVRSESWL